MTQKTVKDNDVCKICFIQDKEKIIKVTKEFKDTKALNKEYELSSVLTCSIKAEKENMTLTYPYLETLKSRISQPIPEPSALDLMKQCCEILKELKEKEIIHRDLKPGNLYIGKKQKLYVGDFETAIAKRWPASINTCGTPGFMAPEQYKSPEVDWLADQYSIGVIFFNILTGTLPFSGESLEEIKEKQSNTTPDPSINNAKLKKPFSELVMKMMNKNKEFRFQTIEEIQKTLESCSQSLKRNEILKDKSVKIQVKKNDTGQRRKIAINLLILLTALILVLIMFKSL